MRVTAKRAYYAEGVCVSKRAAQLKTILVAKWEVPVSKRERLQKRVVTQSLLFVRGTTVFRAMVISPRETPTFRASTFCASQVSHRESTHIPRTSVLPKVHTRRPQGFGNLPMSRPGLGKLPTRTTIDVFPVVSGVFTPNYTQLGWVSPYGYETSPPRSGLYDNYGMRPAEIGPQITLFTTQITSAPFPCC